VPTGEIHVVEWEQLSKLLRANKTKSDRNTSSDPAASMLPIYGDIPKAYENLLLFQEKRNSKFPSMVNKLWKQKLFSRCPGLWFV